jgi:hypothetical protein
MYLLGHTSLCWIGTLVAIVGFAAPAATQQPSDLSGALAAIAQQVRADSSFRYDADGKHAMPEVWHVLGGDTLTLSVAHAAGLAASTYSPFSKPCTPRISATDTRRVHFQALVRVKEWSANGGTIVVERRCLRMQQGREVEFESSQDYDVAWTGQRWRVTLGRRSIT